MQSSSNELDNTTSVALKEDEQQLGEVTITAVERKNTEVVMVQTSQKQFRHSEQHINGRFTGKHTISSDALDWSIGYAYANRNFPDRHRYLTDDALESGTPFRGIGSWGTQVSYLSAQGTGDTRHKEEQTLSHKTQTIK